MQAVDLFDSATFERGIPHDYFAWLREHEPVHWQAPSALRADVAIILETEQRGYWAVSRYRDIVEISLDQERFSSERGTVLNNDLTEERMAQLRLWMINQDAPRHTKLRKLINKGFTKRVIERRGLSQKERMDGRIRAVDGFDQTAAAARAGRRRSQYRAKRTRHLPLEVQPQYQRLSAPRAGLDGGPDQLGLARPRQTAQRRHRRPVHMVVEPRSCKGA